MKRKLTLILYLMLFVTGCTSEYNLKISNNSFKENINFVIENSLDDTKGEGEIEEDNPLPSLIENKIPSLITQDKYYKKKIDDLGDAKKIELSYKYNSSEFRNSNSINNCFEYPEFDFSDNYYIHLQGTFYCLYSDSLDIKIQTKNKVYSNNADEVLGNTYIWHINEANMDYVDIEINVDKGISIWTIVTYIFVGVLIVLLSYAGYKFYINTKEQNKI